MAATSRAPISILIACVGCYEGHAPEPDAGPETIVDSSTRITDTGAIDSRVGDSAGVRSDGGRGTPCVTHLDPACGDGEFCDFPDNLCGLGAIGVCTPRPTDCERTIFESTCACNGLVWENECVVMANGFDPDDAGGCITPPETYACGSHICRVGMEYCRIGISDVGGEPDSYECIASPARCTGTTDCGCFGDSVACSDMCENEGGNFFLTCPGGSGM